ncbi:hypothetical protein [Streptomyces sp. NPDC056707]|uniref:hypothetical protein n=1 Tax=Streptomyces sp. NPDC056707 TaxID=3345919 RepID=UPI0036CCC1D1
MSRLTTMQMSEPYATTVAAVAPVIWLVGAVEVYQAIKRMEQLEADGAEELAQGLRAIRAEADGDAVERLYRQLRRPLPKQKQRALSRLYIFWLLITFMLVWVTLSALAWLAEDGGPGKETGAAPVLALSSLVVVGLGFLVVTVVPVSAAIGRMRGARMRRTDLLKDVRDEVAARRAAPGQAVPAQMGNLDEGDAISPSP